MKQKFVSANIKICCLLIFMFFNTTQRTAKLELVSVQPLYFNLSFSEPTKYPDFQLLVNQPAIQHKAISNTSQVSSSYIIEGVYPDDMSQQNLLYQKYMIIFSFPLMVGNGDLNVDSFILLAEPLLLQTSNSLVPMEQKNSYYTFQNQHNQLKPLAITIAVISYFLSLTTVIGLNTFFFITIYAYIALKSPLYTSMDYQLSYYFLSEPHSLNGDIKSQILYSWIPYLIILITLILGLISRKTLQKKAQTSWFWNQVYTLFSYKLFLLSWNMFLVSILINSIHFIKDIQHFSEVSSAINYCYIYLGFAITVIFLGLIITIMNPHIKQPYQKFDNYIKSKHFLVYESFHNGIQISNWRKRNYILFMVVSRIVILASLAISSSLIPNLFIQVLILIYLFAVRPFKKDFFNNAQIGIQIVVVLFYLYWYIVNLYVTMSQQITTTTDISKILLTNIIFLGIIIFGYFILGIFELYDKIRNILIVSNQWQKIKATFYSKQAKNNSMIDKDQQYMEMKTLTRRKSSLTKRRDPQSQIQRTKQPYMKLPQYNQRSEQTDNKVSPRYKNKKQSNLNVLVEEEDELDRERTVYNDKKSTNGKKSKSKIKKNPMKKQSLLQNMINNTQSQR